MSKPFENVNEWLAALHETLLEHAAASTSESASESASERRALVEARVKRFLEGSESPSSRPS